MGSASFSKRAQALLRVRNQLLRECLAELLAVFVLIVSGARGLRVGWGRGRARGGHRWGPAAPRLRCAPGRGRDGAAWGVAVP